VESIYFILQYDVVLPLQPPERTCDTIVTAGGITIMIRSIDAIYEDGLFRPLEDVDLPNQEKVRLLFLPESEVTSDDDLSAWAIALLAERSPSFAFLADPREDIYILEDGEPVQ
jgi:hypothetical protein